MALLKADCMAANTSSELLSFGRFVMLNDSVWPPPLAVTWI